MTRRGTVKLGVARGVNVGVGNGVASAGVLGLVMPGMVDDGLVGFTVPG